MRSSVLQSAPGTGEPGEMRDGRWQMAAGNPGQLLEGLGGLVGWWGARWSGEVERNNEDNHCLLEPAPST